MKYTGIAAVCLLLLALLPASCIKDDYAAKEKATVQVTFTTRAIGNPVANAGGLEANEHMRTLRVIVARKSGEILYNLKYEIGEEETSKTITFSELTVNADGEAFDFYAIANEEGVGYTDKSWDNVSVADLKGMELPATFLTDANASTNTKIPQTAYMQITVAPQAGGGIQSATMKLDFAVSKVRLTITNTSSGEQNVNDIKLSGVNMTSTLLFAGETLLGENNNETLDLGDMTIPANESATVYAYFFENQNSNGYKLTAFWKKNQTLLLQTGSDDNKQTITEIPRGTELNINITLSATSEPEFNIEVVPWEEVNVDVPPFQ